MSERSGTYGVRVSKEYFNFGSAHFLIFADGTREELHGHNYRVRVALSGDVGPGDMVIDFIKLKPIVRRCCDSRHHLTLLPHQNERLRLETRGETVEAVYLPPTGDPERFAFPARDVKLLPIPNTSTECLARLLGGWILDAIEAELPDATVQSFQIEVEESSGQCGSWAVELGKP